MKTKSELSRFELKHVRSRQSDIADTFLIDGYVIPERVYRAIKSDRRMLDKFLTIRTNREKL